MTEEVQNGRRNLSAEALLHELQVHQIELEMQNDELRQARDAIEESRNRYLDLYDFAPIGYLTLDPAGLIIEANITSAELLATPRHALLKQAFSSFVRHEDRQRWSRQFNALFVTAPAPEETCEQAGTADREGFELAIMGANGVPFHARLYASRLERRDAPPLARLALTDVTERKRAEEALKMADQRKDEFLAMLGHELRNPLTPIRNVVHVLGSLGIRDPQVSWAREIIQRQVAHLKRLVDDLLDVSRIVSGKISLRQETLALADMVEQALTMARPLMEAKVQQFRLDLPKDPVWLRGDPVRLAQILHNLLDNAAKYTPDGGHIELLARLDGDTLVITLRDNGIGIPGALGPHIFDMFQQGEGVLNRAQGGLGIGLTLARRLVELHGGQIEAASPGPGLGSEFTVRMPILAATPETSQHRLVPPLAKLASQSAPMRILVVDDDPDVAESTVALLALEGHEVRSTHRGETALEWMPVFRPRLVLLDIGLGGMDGYEVARRMRALHPPEASLSLVAVTGYGHGEARVRAMEAGFDAFLVKPVFPEHLIELIDGIDEASGPQCQTLPWQPAGWEPGPGVV